MSITNFSEKLIIARKEKGFTQDEFALRLGVTPQAVSKWERSNGYPDVELLCSIANILGCSLDSLLDIKTKSITENADELQKKKLMQNILAEPLVIEIGTGLVELCIDESQNKFKHLHKVREHLALKYGILLPLVRIKDTDSIGEYDYYFYSYDKVIGSGSLNPFVNYVDEKENAIITIMNNFETVCYDNYPKLLNKEIVNSLVSNLKPDYPSIIEDVIPDKISLTNLVKILGRLVEKGQSIRNLIKIIEITEDEIMKTDDLDSIVDTIIEYLE